MGDRAQKQTPRNDQTRLVKRRMARFEVRGLDADRELIRSLAKQLAEGGPDAARIRASVRQALMSKPPKKGGTVAALRNLPLIGADLNLSRSRAAGRKIDF
jgi:hypothetical protein